MYLRGLLLMREREEEGKRKEGKEERMEGKGGAEGERPCAPLSQIPGYATVYATKSMTTKQH